MIGYDVLGKVVVIDDSMFDVCLNFMGISYLMFVWMLFGILIDNDDVIDGCVCDVGFILLGGLVIWMVDMLFGIIVLMYCMNSLDYGIVIFGEIELILDDGVLMLVE